MVFGVIGGRKIDAIAFETSHSAHLRGIGIFNCAGKCTAQVKIYRGDNGKYNGMDIIGESERKEFGSASFATPAPIELRLKRSVRLEEYQKYTVELLQKNEDEAISYQIKNGKSEVVEEDVGDDDFEISFTRAALSKNGTNVLKGAIPCLYFQL